MTLLKDAKVRRGGVTAHYWYETIDHVDLAAKDALHLRFSMASKGGGHTQVQMEIGPEGFPTLLEMMSIVDREAAMLAMAQELSRQIATQSERNHRLVSNTRSAVAEEILNAARNNFLAKPPGQDGEERTIFGGVRKIIDTLGKRKKQ